MFNIGQTVENQYLVLEKNRGRRWILYVALDLISENVFVIKRPSDGLPPGFFLGARFKDKARAWISVGECDEIVKAYLVKEFNGIPHLFIDYVDGPSLADILYLSPGKPLPTSQTINLMKQLAAGMRFLHAASLPSERDGIIHGGLTPRNILTTGGNIKITDIGLSNAIPQSGRPGPPLIFDKLPYMAPEQIANPQGADKLTDIYSFGAVMYEVATGTPPRVNMPSSDPLADAVKSEPVPPSLRNRSCPKWLEEIILKCMARKPENRFQSFDQLGGLIRDLASRKEVLEEGVSDNSEASPASRIAGVRGVAKKESRRMDHYYLGVEHLVLALLKEEESVMVSCFGDIVTSDYMLEKIISRLPKGEGQWYWDGIRKTPRYERVMKLARKIKRMYASPGDRMLPQHLLLAILEEGRSIPVRVQRELGVDIGKAIENLKREIMRRRPAIVIPELGIPGARFVGRVLCTSEVPYSTPFIGRRSELERARDILLNDRRSMLLVGETGVGKTAMVHELACRIPEAGTALGPGRGGVFKLRLGAFLASTVDAGQACAHLEELLSGIISANAILMIEDVNLLLDMSVRMPAGGAAAILNDYIASRGLLVIATATPAGYASCESMHGELVQRLEVINLHEPLFEEALEMLKATRGRFELEHFVSISDEALASVLKFSEKLPSDMALPAKAFELLDHVCAALSQAEESGASLEPISITAEHVERAIHDESGHIADGSKDWVLDP